MQTFDFLCHILIMRDYLIIILLNILTLSEFLFLYMHQFLQLAVYA